MESPYPSKKFEYRHNVENVILGIDSSACIVEDTGRVKKKRENKKKKILKREDLPRSEEELQRKAEAMVVKQTEDHDTRGRKSLGVRIKSKFYETFYGTEAKPEEKKEKRELDRLIEEEKNLKK